MPYTRKKTVQQIIANGNDYLITVKANQPKLLEQIERQFQQYRACSTNHQVERTRDRFTERIVSVLEPAEGIDAGWVGLQRLIRVERRGTRAHQPFHETMFYISSLSTNAAEFAQRIRQHWHIENRLHWVKDAVLHEDHTPCCDGHALINFAIVRTIVLNLFRSHGLQSITAAIRELAHDIPRLFSFFK